MVETKERPIIFTGQSLPAILSSRKTQTRRVIKPPNFNSTPCPYGNPGDSLWVREGWRIESWDENKGLVRIQYKADGYTSSLLSCTDPDMFERFWIQSTDDALAAGVQSDPNGQFHWETGEAPTRWRSPIFMPRWASRISLSIVNVRIQRLQQLSRSSIHAEGFSNSAQFASAWDKLNAKRGFSWASNPPVWVISFQRRT